MGIIKPTAENLHAFIQWAFDAFPESGRRYAENIGATKTNEVVTEKSREKATYGTGYVINKNKKSNTQATATTPNKNTKGWSWD